MPRVEGKITMEGVRVVLRNFAGKAGPMNAPGDRNFCVTLDDDGLVEKLQRDGWNVKFFPLREAEDKPQAYLPVKISFKGRAPMVYLITSRGRTRLRDEDDLDILDVADIETADIIVRPYNWEVRGETGVKAYVESMYVKIYEDDLARKYGDMEEIPTRSGRIDEG